MKDQLLDRQARQPAGFFQLRLVVEMADVADAQVGDRHDLARDAERILQFRLVEDAHPADAEAFGAGGEPEVLDGADAAVQVHRLDVRAADDDRPGPLAVAGDAQAERRFDDAFQFQLAVDFPLALRKHQGGFGVGLGKAVPDALLDLGRADQQEVPRLHEADRRRMMGRHQHAAEYFVGDRIGQELAAHVAAIEDGAIDGGPFGLRKR